MCIDLLGLSRFDALCVILGARGGLLHIFTERGVLFPRFLGCLQCGFHPPDERLVCDEELDHCGQAGVYRVDDGRQLQRAGAGAVDLLGLSHEGVEHAHHDGLVALEDGEDDRRHSDDDQKDEVPVLGDKVDHVHGRVLLLDFVNVGSVHAAGVDGLGFLGADE